MNKRGISTVIGTFLFIIITIVALGIFWAAYNKLIHKGSSADNFDCTTLDLKITACVFFFNQTDLNNDGEADLEESALYSTFKREIGDGKIDSIRMIAYAINISFDNEGYVLEPQNIDSLSGKIDTDYSDLVELTTKDAVNFGGIPSSTVVLSANVAAVVGNTICPEKNEPVECKCVGPLYNNNNLVYTFVGAGSCRQEIQNGLGITIP